MAKGKEKNAEKEGEGTWGKGRGARGQREEGDRGKKGERVKKKAGEYETFIFMAYGLFGGGL